MPGNKFTVCFLLLVLMLFQTAWPGLSEAAKPEMLQANFALHNDETTGEPKLRLVVDVGRPVQVSAVTSGTPEPRLIVNVKGVAPGSLTETLRLDGKIARSVDFKRVNSTHSQLIIHLPQTLANTDYRVFTLPDDAQANRPFRVVVDLQKPSTAAKDKQDSRPARSDSSRNELKKANFAVHTDAVTGMQKLRLVIDASSTVQTSAQFTATPDPRLVVNIQGADAGRLPKGFALDGTIADSVSFSRIDDTNSQMVIHLPAILEEGDYRVFALPADPKAKRPFRIVVDINKQPAPVEFDFTPGLKGKVIVLDPGHGGSDPGAIGLDKTYEKTVTLAVAQRVAALLEKAGAKVVMTRRDDRDVFGAGATAVEELGARTKVANAIKADLFLSIHANAFGNRAVGGTSTHYYQKSRYDKLLAVNLQESLVAAAGLTDRGIQPANFYVVKRTLMPAALVELAFISNPDEEKLLNTPKFQQKFAQGIVNGLDQFFSQAAVKGGGK